MSKSDYSELEESIRREFTKVTQLETIRQVPLFIWLPMDFIAEKLGFNNYRLPSISGLQDLKSSIQKVGLLEWPVINIIPDTGELVFFDGRRRMGACYIANYAEVPFEIYNLPEEEMAELELSLNALKTRIPILNKINRTERLEYELSTIEDWDDKKLNREIASILHCKPATVVGYRTFLNAHVDIKNYAQKNPNLRLYSQVKKIVKFIPDKNQQNQFFAWYKQEHLEAKENAGKLNPTVFSHILKKQAEIFAAERQKKAEEDGFDDGDLVMITKQANSLSYKKVKNVANAAKNTISYLQIFTRLLALDPNMQTALIEHPFENGGFKAYVNHFKEEFKTYLSKSPETIRTKVTNLLEHKVEDSFAETHIQKMLSLQSGKKKGRPAVYGDTPIYIPVDQVEKDPDNLRDGYDVKRISGLVKDVKKSGQIKAGIVKRMPKKNKFPYRCIVGNSRLEVVTLAGIKYYKAFVMKKVDPALITILQAAEDLFEDDGYYARAMKLYDNYQLQKKIKKQKGIAYTPEMFIQDKAHLAPKKTIEDAMYVMSLSDITKYVIREKLLSAESGKAMERAKLNDVDKISVIVNAITNKFNTKQTLYYIHNLLQPEFEFKESTHSYYGLVSNFQKQLSGSLQQLKTLCNGNDKSYEILQNSQQVFLRFANVYNELNGLLHGIGMLETKK